MKEVIDKRRKICNKKIECYFDNVGEGKKGNEDGYKDVDGEFRDVGGKEGKDEEGKSEANDEGDQRLDKTYDQDKDIHITHTFLSSFYFLLVNQEIYLWSLLFPNDLHIILKRLTALDLPLGYSKFERFVYAIFKVYFWEEKNLKGKLDKIYLKIKDKKGIECIKKMENYVEIKNVHEWVYNAFLYKSLKEYLSDGIIEI